MRESFLKSAAAGRMGVPTIPLTDLYNAAGEYIRARGGVVLCRTSVDSFRAEMSHVRLGIAPGGAIDGGAANRSGDDIFDYVVLAVPFDGLARLLPVTSASQ